MMLQSPQAIEGDVFGFIKELSGKLIERRRRRDRVSQSRLAQVVTRSERWLREIEAGVATSMLEDHIRCAHALQMATPHLFIPLLAMEHKMAVPRELLLQDDLWDLECELLEVVGRHQHAVASRLSARASVNGRGER
ncbi:MAG: transcriptional regulator [Candidatus Sphingomonas colombiensis]|nr:transcriptional regulator [Sphingomonas sp.]WEK43262.1 MAG: transcriptional regulator [Sphingomonas sp.]